MSNRTLNPTGRDGVPDVRHLPRARTVADPGDVTFLLAVVGRWWRLILAAGAMGGIVGGLYFLVATPLYLASSRILIDFRRLSPIGENELLINFKVNDSAVDSQTAIIEAEGVMRPVIQALKLHQDPEFIGHARWWKSVLGLLKIVDDPARMTESERMQTAVEQLAKRLKAQRVGTSYVLEVTVKSEDAGKAAHIVDEVAAAYVRDQLTSKQDVASGANDWFSQRVQALNDQVAQAQNAAVAYRKNNQVMLAVGKFIDEQQVVDIGARLTAARNDRAQAVSKLARIQQVLSVGGLEGGVVDEFQNQVIVGIRQKYFEMSRFAAENATRVGENHDATVRARASMKEMEKSIANEFQRIAQGYRSDAEVAKARELSLTREMEELATRSADAQKARVEMAQLDSIAQNFQSIRDNFLSRYTELAQEQTFPITETRILNKASVPEKRHSPRASISLIGGVGIGLLLGFLMALCIQILSRRARMREAVETVTDAPCLAYLPNLDGEQNSWLRQLVNEAGKRWPAIAPPRVEIARADHLETAVRQPFGIFAEGLRSIKIAVNAKLEGRRGIVLAFISAVPGEGTSTVAANFAGMIAASGQRTILVDFDLRHRSLTRQIAPNAPLGLQSVYCDLPNLLKALSVLKSGVHFLPAVDGQTRIHPSELAASAAMRQLMGLLRRTFDFIVLDLPAAIPVIDGRAVADLVDEYVLVVEWNRTTLDTIGEAMAANPQIAQKLIGFAFNKVSLEGAKRIGDFAAITDAAYVETGLMPVKAQQPTTRIA
jgi:polysaccharide biosynthesis transport protein